MVTLLPVLAICSVICSAPDAPAKELPADYFMPQAVIDVIARTKVGKEFTADRAFVFHRVDVEKIHVLGTTLKHCERDRDRCEVAELERVSDPPFFDSFVGKTILVGGGVAVGVGITILILFATGSAG